MYVTHHARQAILRRFEGDRAAMVIEALEAMPGCPGRRATVLETTDTDMVVAICDEGSVETVFERPLAQIANMRAPLHRAFRVQEVIAV